jgi:hypothetical protein
VSWLERWSPIGGLLFAGVIVTLMASPLMEEFGETAPEVVAFAETNAGWITTMTRLLVVSVLFLAWFLGGLYLRLQRSGEQTAATFGLIGGVAFGLLFFLTTMLWMAPLVELDDAAGAVQTAQAESYGALRDLGVFTLSGAGVAAGLMLIAVSLAARRIGLVPRWGGWIGVALGIIALGTGVLGVFAWLVWILTASVLLLRPQARRQA